MRHTNTPDETGWYWIADHPHEDEDWRLCYLYAEESPQKLICFDPDLAKLRRQYYSSAWTLADGAKRWSDDEIIGGSWCGPKVWYGPLPHPGGPFGACIIEADEETHEKAAAKGKAIVIKHTDCTHCDDALGTVTEVSLISKDEALGKAGAKCD